MPVALNIDDPSARRGLPAPSVRRRGGLSRDGMGITELAATLGTTSRALRYYEELGLITPQRNPRGVRTYGPGVRRALELIVMLRRADRSIREIQTLLSADGADGEATRIRVAAALRARLDELDSQSRELRTLLTRFSGTARSEA